MAQVIFNSSEHISFPNYSFCRECYFWRGGVTIFIINLILKYFQNKKNILKIKSFNKGLNSKVLDYKHSTLTTRLQRLRTTSPNYKLECLCFANFFLKEALYNKMKMKLSCTTIPCCLDEFS